MTLIGIGIILVAIFVFLGETPYFHLLIIPTSNSFIQSNMFLSLVYKYWKIEDIVVLIIGIAFLYVGLS